MQAQTKFHGMQLVLYCAMALFVSGYAFQVFGFSLPAIARDWHLPGHMVGPLLSTAIFGHLLGYVFVAPLADRFGARPVICGSLLGLAAATVICLAAPGFTVLTLGRVLTGIAIGGALPSAVSIASQHGPHRWRGAQVVAIYAAFSLGFLVAEFASAWLVPWLGWRAPCALTIPCALALAALLRRGLSPGGSGVPVVRALTVLFASELRTGTVLFWIMLSIGLGQFYALQAWLPLLTARDGLSISDTLTASSMFTLGSALGAVPMIWWADRMGPFRALVAMSGVGLTGIVLLGTFAAQGGGAFQVASLLAGIGIGGGQKGMIAAAALFYPPSVRSTGLGFALGLGRLGAACGPLLIGFLTVHQIESGTALLCLGLPVPLVMLAAAWLERRYGRIDRAVRHPPAL